MSGGSRWCPRTECQASADVSPYRIVRLLNGRHHLDEIRYRSKLSRKQLQTVLTAFDNHLVFFHHA